MTHAQPLQIVPRTAVTTNDEPACRFAVLERHFCLAAVAGDSARLSAALGGYYYNHGAPPSRTLVVLVGGLRVGEVAWRSLYDNLLDLNQQPADLALLLDALPSAYQNASLFERAKYVWRVPHQQEDWSDLLDRILDNTTTWRARFFAVWNPVGSNMAFGPLNGTTGSGLIVLGLRSLLGRYLCGPQCDRPLRPFCSDPIGPLLHVPARSQLHNPNYVWVPFGEDWFGLRDRHFVASSRHILSALDLLPSILHNPEKYADLLTRPMANSEQVVLQRWQEEGAWLVGALD